MSDFIYEIIINESIDLVFKSFSDPAILAKWWGPKGFTNTFDQFNFTKNGDWIFVMHGPDGVSYPNRSKFLEIIQNSFIKIRHDCEPYFDLCISLNSDPLGTKLKWVGDFENKDFVNRLRDFLDVANKQNLERLQAVIAQNKLAQQVNAGEPASPAP